MDKELYAESRIPKELPAKDLQSLASQVAQIAIRYHELAKRIAELPSGTLPVTGRKNAEKGEKALRTWLKTIQAAMDALPTDFSKLASTFSTDDELPPGTDRGETVVTNRKKSVKDKQK